MRVWQQVQEELLSNYPEGLILSGWSHNHDPLDIFVKNLFLRYFKDHCTVNPKDLTVQCIKGKRRSIGDIFLVCRYYYPTCTLKEIYNLLSITYVKKIFSIKCNEIGKKTYAGFYFREIVYSNPYSKNEYGWTLDSLI